MRTLAIVIALAIFGVAAAAGAQPQTERVTTYGEGAFTDELVKGQLLRPDGDVTQSRLAAGRRSLIRIRTDFVDSMLKSVERQ